MACCLRESNFRESRTISVVMNARVAYPLLLLGLLCALWAAPANREASPFQDRHVLIIGIDGCRPDSIAEAEAPHLQKLIGEGVITYQAIAGGDRFGPANQATSSGPGWSSILTGGWRDKHGVANNNFTGNRFQDYPHFFRRLKESEPKACLSSIVSWNPIDTDIVAPVAAFTDYRGKGIGSNYSVRDRWVCDDAVRHLGSANPDVLFLHFDQVDGAGHASGFTSSNNAYLQAIANVDGMIGEVLNAINERPNRDEEKWLVLVTTDHGGLGTSHGGQSEDEREIFLIASGDGTSPVVSQESPGHTAIPPTVFEYLGVPVSEEWGWEPAFGLPPYPPSQLRVTQGLDRDMVVRWNAPIELDAQQLVLKRNGGVVAELPLTATQYVDRIPPLFLALQVVYTLEVEGASQEITPLQLTTALPQSMDDDQVLHWTFEDLTTLGDDVSVSGSVTSTAGAFRGRGVQIGTSDHIGSITQPMTDALTFGRFTPFSIGFWIRTHTDQEGVLLGNRRLGAGPEEGWLLSMLADGSLQWRMSDGIRQVTLNSSPGALSADGRWRHIGLSVERLEEVTLYLDGQAMVSQDIDALRASDGAGPFSLGADANGEAPVNVHLDDLRIWRRDLSPLDWQSLYAERAAASQWWETAFTFEERLDPQIGTWSADADQDGRSNLEEFALNSNPREPDFAQTLEVMSRSDRITLTWLQPTGGRGDPSEGYLFQGVRSHIEFSDQLQAKEAWLPLEPNAIETRNIVYQPDGTHRQEWQLAPSAFPRFFRLRYTMLNDD